MLDSLYDADIDIDMDMDIETAIDCIFNHFYALFFISLYFPLFEGVGKYKLPFIYRQCYTHSILIKPTSTFLVYKA